MWGQRVLLSFPVTTPSSLYPRTPMTGRLTTRPTPSASVHLFPWTHTSTWGALLGLGPSRMVAQPGHLPPSLILSLLVAAACSALPAPPYQLQLNPQGPPCLPPTTRGPAGATGVFSVGYRRSSRKEGSDRGHRIQFYPG